MIHLARIKNFLLIVVVVSVLLTPNGQVLAEDVWCFCYDDYNKITQENYKKAEKEVLATGCASQRPIEMCIPAELKKKGIVDRNYEECVYQDKQGIRFANQRACYVFFEQWKMEKELRIKEFDKMSKASKPGRSAFIPECLLGDKFDKSCEDVGIFVIFAINAASYLFTIVGALALLMFVYGGFTLILSSGNPERVKRGTGIIIAAVIGLAIVFVAYILVQFLGQTVGVL